MTTAAMNRPQTIINADMRRLRQRNGALVLWAEIDAMETEPAGGLRYLPPEDELFIYHRLIWRMAKVHAPLVCVIEAGATEQALSLVADSSDSFIVEWEPSAPKYVRVILPLRNWEKAEQRFLELVGGLEVYSIAFSKGAIPPARCVQKLEWVRDNDAAFFVDFEILDSHSTLFAVSKNESAFERIESFPGKLAGKGDVLDTVSVKLQRSSSMNLSRVRGLPFWLPGLGILGIVVCGGH